MRLHPTAADPHNPQMRRTIPAHERKAEHLRPRDRHRRRRTAPARRELDAQLGRRRVERAHHELRVIAALRRGDGKGQDEEEQ